ncbi:MAG: nucleotide exchange factor GrpE [Eubacteriales bacterium]|nr:nucleotide exchange factor GrpE [Eubacteriales bacterium]
MKEKNNAKAQTTAAEQTTKAEDQLSTTEKLIADLEAKAKANLDLAKYQKAEFENYKRRNQNAVAASFQDGQTYVVNLLLPIYDGVVEAGKKIADPADLAGFEIIRKKLDDLFEKLGIEPIQTKDQPFDPKLHNAVAVEKVDGVPADQILEEWQKGFTFHGHVLRPAMVKVSGA